MGTGICEVSTSDRVWQRSSQISKKSRASLSLSGIVASVIDHQHVDLTEPPKQVPQASVRSRQSQIAKQRRGARVESRVAVATRLVVRQSAGQITFPHVRRTANEDVLVAVRPDRVGGGQRSHQCFIEPSRRAIVNVLDTGVGAQEVSRRVEEVPLGGAKRNSEAR